MIAPIDPNPFAPSTAAERQARESHMREMARRRWEAQQDLRRRRTRRLALDRVQQIRQLRPGRAVASSLSPVYNMFNDRFLRRR